MVTRVEPRIPLVEDALEEEDLALGNSSSRVSAFDAASICTMDVVEEHRYRPHNSVMFDTQGIPPAAPPAPRPRSPSIYSMFVTDHSHSKPRCKNPSVYSMPIAAYRARDDFDGDIDGMDEDEDEEDEDGIIDDGSESDDDDDDHSDDRVFMTKRSQRVGVRKIGGRHTNVHHHMNFKTRVKNPSVYSMPILGSNRETPAPHELRVAPLVPLPFAEEEVAPPAEKDENMEDGATGGYSPTPNGHANPRLKRVSSRRVRPASMRDNIANGFTSCRGRPNDDSLPPSYHVAVCMGFLGVLFLFGGMAMAIVGFTSSPDMNNADTLKALRVLGPLALSVGILMCIGCFVYMCVVYLRYKRLSAYLKRRHSARRFRTAPDVTSQEEAQAEAAQAEAAHAQAEAAQAEANRVLRYHNPENAAEDIRQMLQSLKNQGEGAPQEPPESARN